MSDKNHSSVRFATINQFVDVHMSKCKPSDVAVYLAIWRYVRGECSEIGHKQLAEITGYSERQVKRSVKALAAMKVIVVLRKGNNLMKKPNLYAIQKLDSASGDTDDTLQTIQKE
tara:strand:- start:2987 stop:3331 length:345 start_codon:yes stop_codon:yes gene_type:complete